MLNSVRLQFMRKFRYKSEEFLLLIASLLGEKSTHSVVLI